MLTELEDRGRRLDAEREQQLAIAAKIAQMQSKLLTGGHQLHPEQQQQQLGNRGNLLDKTRRQQELLQRKRIELAAQRVQK